MIRSIDKEEYKSELEIINKVIKNDLIYQYPSYDGITLNSRYELIREDYTKKEYKNYIKQYIYLITKCPKVFMKERIETYIQSANNGALWEAGYMRDLFVTTKDLEYKLLFKSSRWLFNKPISLDLRYKVMKSVEIEHIYNHIIPTIFVILFSLFLLLTRQYKEFFLSCGMLIKIPIIFLTEPSGWFMYWLNFYMIGYIVLYYTILYWLSRKECN